MKRRQHTTVVRAPDTIPLKRRYFDVQFPTIINDDRVYSSSSSSDYHSKKKFPLHSINKDERDFLYRMQRVDEDLAEQTVRISTSKNKVNRLQELLDVETARLNKDLALELQLKTTKDLYRDNIWQSLCPRGVNCGYNDCHRFHSRTSFKNVWCCYYGKNCKVNNCEFNHPTQS
jgi:hypothetical protein